MYAPSLPEFLKLAAQGNLIPVTRKLLADIETPLSAYRKIRGPGESFLFESVEGGEHIGRYSFVGCNPRAIIRQTEAVVDVLENGKVKESFSVGGPGAPVSDPTISAVEGDMARSETGAAGRRKIKDGLEIVERVMKKY